MTAKKIVYYHGFQNGKCVLSYTCGYCQMHVDDKDYFCRWCGAKFEEKEMQNADT